MNKGKAVFLAFLVLFSVSSVAGASLQIDALSQENINASYRSDGVHFQTNYLNKTVPYEKLIKPDDLRTKDGVLVKNKTEKTDSTEIQFSFQVASDSKYTWLQDAKFSGKISIKKGDKKSNFVNGTLTSDSDEAIEINSDSHYEHLILDYNLSDTGVEKNSSSNVYSGNDTEKVTIGADAREIDPGKGVKNITYDNLYEDSETEIFYFTAPERANLTNIDVGGLNYSEVNYSYSDVKQELRDANINESFILNSTDGYHVRAFNVSVPADSKVTVSASYEYPYKKETGNSVEFIPTPEFTSYVVGSGGSVTYSSSTTLCGDVTNSGSQYDSITVDSGVTISVCDKGSGNAGYVNLTAKNQVVVNGTINGVGRGYNGGAIASSEGSPGNAGSGTGAGGGGGVDSSQFEAGSGGGAGFGASGGSGTGFNGASGGSAGSTYTGSKVTLGSGGGSGGHVCGGDGSSVSQDRTGDGGGAVMIRSPKVDVYGTVNVDGQDANMGATSSGFGGHGGGSGGKILVEAKNAVLQGNLYSRGGDGSDSSAQTNCEYAGGSGGGGGRVVVKYTDSLESSSLTKSLSGGGFGVDAYDGDDPSGNPGNTGVYSTSQESSLGFNFAPALVNQTYWSNESSGGMELRTDIDNGGENDIEAYTGLSNVLNFTNSTLDASINGLPFSVNYNVSDSKGAFSSTLDLQIDDKHYGVQEYSSFSHDTATQQVENVWEFINNGADSWSFEKTTLDKDGSLVSGDRTITGSVASGSSANGSIIYQGDWITGESTSTGKSSNQSRSHNFSRQYMLNGTTFHAENTKSFGFKDVNISSYCSGVGLKDVDPGQNDIPCQTTEYPGDYLINEQNYSAEWDSGDVVIGSGIDQNFTGAVPVYVENTEPATFDVDMSSMVTAPSSCSVSSYVAQVSGNQAGNSSVTMDCDPGYEIDYSPVSKTELSNDYEYTYAGNIHVEGNVSSNSPIDYCIPETRLDNWDVREPDQFVIKFDGSEANTGIYQTTSGGSEYVCLTKKTGSPSLLSGDHSVTFKYYESKDTGQTDSGSSSGSLPPTQTTPIQNVTGEYDWLVSALGSTDTDFQFYGHPGEKQSVPISLQNTGDRPVNLTLSCVGSGEACQHVNIETNQVQFNAEDFKQTIVRVEWTVPENYDRDKLDFRVRVTDPSWSAGKTEGVAYVDFTVDTGNPLLSKLIDRFSRVVTPFVVIPFFVSLLSFALMRTISDKRGGILAGHVFLTIFIFLVVLGVVPPVPFL